MKTIIVADDQHQMRKVFIRVLGRTFDVHAVADGDEVMPLIETLPQVDLIISDVEMMRMSGTQMVLTVRAGGYTGPIILMTGNNSIADGLRASNELSIDAVLEKPITYDAIIKAVSATL